MFEDLKKIRQLSSIKDQNIFYEAFFNKEDIIKLFQELKNNEVFNFEESQSQEQLSNNLELSNEYFESAVPVNKTQYGGADTAGLDSIKKSSNTFFKYEVKTLPRSDGMIDFAPYAYFFVLKPLTMVA